MVVEPVLIKFSFTILSVKFPLELLMGSFLQEIRNKQEVVPTEVINTADLNSQE